MQASMPPSKISVALVAYQHAPYLRQALDSIFAQRLECSWELVVADDASTDGSAAIIADYAARHPDVVRILPREHNLGMHRNFLGALEACRGELVAVLEGDDFWTAPDKLRLQQTYLDEHPECPACFHPVNVVDETGQSKEEVFPGVRKALISLPELLHSNEIPTCSLMFRRTLLPSLPTSIRTLSMADWPLFIQFARQGDLGCIDTAMASYRQHPAGAWTSQNETARLQKIIAMHEWLLAENLSGDPAAAWSALGLWEARQALHHANAGALRQALHHLLLHLRASLRAHAAPRFRMIAKTLLAMLRQPALP